MMPASFSRTTPWESTITSHAERRRTSVTTESASIQTQPQAPWDLRCASGLRCASLYGALHYRSTDAFPEDPLQEEPRSSGRPRPRRRGPGSPGSSHPCFCQLSLTLVFFINLVPGPFLPGLKHSGWSHWSQTWAQSNRIPEAPNTQCFRSPIPKAMPQDWASEASGYVTADSYSRCGTLLHIGLYKRLLDSEDTRAPCFLRCGMYCSSGRVACRPNRLPWVGGLVGPWRTSLLPKDLDPLKAPLYGHEMDKDVDVYTYTYTYTYTSTYAYTCTYSYAKGICMCIYIYMYVYVCVYVYVHICVDACLCMYIFIDINCISLFVRLYVCGCCPKFLVPEMATFTRKKSFRETFAEPSPCMILITSSFGKRKRKRERER